MKFKYAFVQKSCVAGHVGLESPLTITQWITVYCSSVLLCYLMCYCNFLNNNIFIFLDSFNDLYTSYVIFCIFLMSVVIIVISIFNVEFYAGGLCEVLIPKLNRMVIYNLVTHPGCEQFFSDNGGVFLSLFFFFNGRFY